MELATLSKLAGLIGPAIELIKAFSGTADEAKNDTVIQDSIKVIGAIVPLIEAAGSGQVVTMEQAREALGDMNIAIEELDAEIAARQNPAP